MKEIDELRQVFLAEPDPEIRADNERIIIEWETKLVQSHAFNDWKSHDITQQIIKQARESYKEMAFQLAVNRTLTVEQRMTLWAKQDAMRYLLTMIDQDAKSVIDGIIADIKRALSNA